MKSWWCKNFIFLTCWQKSFVPGKGNPNHVLKTRKSKTCGLSPKPPTWTVYCLGSISPSFMTALAKNLPLNFTNNWSSKFQAKVGAIFAKFVRRSLNAMRQKRVLILLVIESGANVGEIKPLGSISPNFVRLAKSCWCTAFGKNFAVQFQQLNIKAKITSQIT